MLGKLAMNYAQQKEVVISVVVSFLLVMLICGSVANFDAFARKKITTLNTCYKSTPDKPGATSADICCTMFYSNGKLSSSLCQKCNYDSDGNKIDCRTYSTRAGELGSVTPPPPSAGLLNARGTGAFNGTTTSNTTKLGNAGNTVQRQPLQQQLQTTTCPNGSTPDAKGNCPPNATLQTLKQPSSDSNNLGKLKGGSESKSNSDNNNDNPTSDHHHKGNDLGKKGVGSETKKDSNGGSDVPQTNQEKTAT